MLYRKDLEANLSVCPKCGHHFRMHAFDRINSLVDGDFVEIGLRRIVPGDPLEWVDKRLVSRRSSRPIAKSPSYPKRSSRAFATLDGFPVALGVMDFNFRGGTMGTVVGERIANLARTGPRSAGLPCIIFTASGGARMEEGMLALMQMAKTSLAVERFMSDGNPYVTVLTDPTTGGVSASFAFQSDVIVAEARASIGFAGRRVIEQTLRQKLPDNFQTAEFLLEKGHVDMVVPRQELRASLVRVLDYAVDRKRVARALKAVPEFAQ